MPHEPGTGSFFGLTRVQLDDQRFIDVGGKLVAIRCLLESTFGLVNADLDPGRHTNLLRQLQCFYNPVLLLRLFANGNDVSTVLVNGRVVMRDRTVLTVNEAEVLTLAQREADAAMARTGLQSLTATPEGFWGRSRFPAR